MTRAFDNSIQITAYSFISLRLLSIFYEAPSAFNIFFILTQHCNTQPPSTVGISRVEESSPLLKAHNSTKNIIQLNHFSDGNGDRSPFIDFTCVPFFNVSSLFTSTILDVVSLYNAELATLQE